MPDLYDETTLIRHNRVRLALHRLRAEPAGRPLLLLHPLGWATPQRPPSWTDPWPGPVYGLDFTGHGRSDVPRGGGYTCEVLMGDADAALARLGPSTIVGHGLGGYVGLLVAGARPRLVRGVAIGDGPGLAGGGAGPTGTVVATVDSDEEGRAPDPWAMVELNRDIRPADYAVNFARQALALAEVDTPIAVCARFRPPWLEAVAAESGVLDAGLPEALAAFAAAG
jgi:pimeloyl-ACP methyl ester carboxylesterase